MRYRVAIVFAIGGDLRFISHKDSLRMFARALCRADLPVRYTAGFNPRPRIWLPLPRPVGITGEVEFLMIELVELLPAPAVLGRLARTLPEGIVLKRAWRLFHAGLPHAVEVRYRVAIPPGQRRDLVRAVQALRESPSHVVARRGGPGIREQTFDVRPSLTDIGWKDGVLEFALHAGPSGVAKPREVLEALQLPEGLLAQVRRIAVDWQPGLGQLAGQD